MREVSSITVHPIWALFNKEDTMRTRGSVSQPLIIRITLAVGALLMMGGMVACSGLGGISHQEVPDHSSSYRG
jgi:hypothetical protein